MTFCLHRSVSNTLKGNFLADAIHILGLSGSLRKGSYNSGLLRAAGELLPGDATLEAFDLNPIPLYNADHDGKPHLSLSVR